MEGRESRKKLSKFFYHVGSFLKKKERDTKKYEKKVVEYCGNKFKDVGKYLDFIPILPIRFRIVDEHVFVSVCPMSVHEIRTMKEFFGVRAIINLNFSTINNLRYYTVRRSQSGSSVRFYEMDDDIMKYYKDFKVYHFPVPEGCTPNDDQLKKIREVLDHHIQEEENVLLVSFSADSIPWTVAGNYLVHYKQGVDVEGYKKRLPKSVQFSENQHQLLHQNWNDSSETMLLFRNNIIHVMKVGSHLTPDICGTFRLDIFSYICVKGQKGRVVFKRSPSYDRKIESDVRKKLSFQVAVEIGNSTFLTYQSLGREMERIMNIIRFKSGNESEADLKFYLEYLFHIVVRQDRFTYVDHRGVERADRKKISEKAAFEERKKSILSRIEEEKIYNLRLGKLEEVFGVISEKIEMTKQRAKILLEKRKIVKERRDSFKKRVIHVEKRNTSPSIQVLKQIQRDEEIVFQKKGKKLWEAEGELKKNIDQLEVKEKKLFAEIYHLREESRSYKQKNTSNKRKR